MQSLDLGLEHYLGLGRERTLKTWSWSWN